MFRLRPQAEDWFKFIFAKDKEGPIQTKFDIFYFCLMAGFASGKLEKATDATDIVANFVSDYKPVQRLILGLLLMVELHRMGADLSDSNQMRKLLSQYVDPSNAANLTDAGFSRLNEYASGGYMFLAERIGDKPHHVENFLQMFVKEVQSAVEANEAWKGTMKNAGVA